MGTKPTAIIAEHSAAVANQIAAAFREAGFEVAAICSDGLSAVQRVRELHPTVLSIDLILPRFGGLQIAEAVAGAHAPQLIAITAVTARTRVADAKRLGVCYYVLKPINAEKLAAALRSMYATQLTSALRSAG